MQVVADVDAVVNAAVYRASVELARSGGWMQVPDSSEHGENNLYENICGDRDYPMGLGHPNEGMRSHMVDGNGDGGAYYCPMGFVSLNGGQRSLAAGT